MKISKEFKIGLFVISIIVGSFFLLNYLRGEDLLNREFEVSARYADVEGLVSSAPVYIKGYKAGKVSSIDYDTESGDFMVTCSVLKDFSIPSDSRMTIYGVDIMGGKGIRIDIGDSQEMVEDGGFISSGSEPALLDGLAAGVVPLMDKAGKTLDSLNVTVSSVNRILADANIARTLSHVEKTMSDVRSIASVIEGRSDELNAFIDNLSIISSKFVTVTDKADTLVSSINSTVSQISDEDVRHLIDSFRDLLNSLNDPDGTIGSLINDDSVYDSLDSLLTDVDGLVRKIQENPKKYLRISVF